MIESLSQLAVLAIFSAAVGLMIAWGIDAYRSVKQEIELQELEDSFSLEEEDA